MACCDSPIVLGCYSHCGELSGGDMMVILPVDADETGTHTVEVDHLGSTITRDFAATTGQPFEIPHIFNEYSKPIIRIKKPSGDYFEAKVDVLTTNISTELSDCFLLAISPTFEAVLGSDAVAGLTIAHSFSIPLYLDPDGADYAEGRIRIGNGGSEAVAAGAVFIIKKPDAAHYATTIDPAITFADAATVHNPDFDIVEFGELFILTYRKPIPVGADVVSLAVRVTSIITGTISDTLNAVIYQGINEVSVDFAYKADLAITVTIDDVTGDIPKNESVDIYFTITNVGGGEFDTGEGLWLSVTKAPSGFSWVPNDSHTVVDVDGGTQVDNGLFTASDGGAFWRMDYNGPNIPPGGSVRYGMPFITASGTTTSSANMSAVFVVTSGLEYDFGNNSTSQSFTITDERPDYRINGLLTPHENVPDTDPVTIFIVVHERYGVDSDGVNPFYAGYTLHSRITETFNPIATSIGGVGVHNAEFTMFPSGGSWWFEYTANGGVFPGGGYKIIGIEGTVDAGGTSGSSAVSMSMFYSGTERDLGNNSDSAPFSWTT